MRRYLVYPFDFDARANTLNIEPTDEWEPQVREQHERNRANLLARLRVELGELNFDTKVQDFADLGMSPFSIVSYHNALFHQARYAFYHGLYYPALVAACALGERILNHLILDLRESFRATPEYKEVYRKDSFDDWSKAIRVLEAWKVFQHENVAGEFSKLAAIRHRSIHFNPETYESLRDDALAALKHLAEIIRIQFGFFAGQRWAIEGTSGQTFIKKEAEEDPFVKTYYLRQCPLVGPLFSISFQPDGILFFDRTEYEGGEIDDATFADLYQHRDPNGLVASTLPPGEGITVQKRFQ